MAEGLRSNDTTDKIDDVVSKIQVLTNRNNQVQETLQTISTMLTSLESKEVSGAMNRPPFLVPSSIAQERRYHEPRYHLPHLPYHSFKIEVPLLMVKTH